MNLRVMSPRDAGPAYARLRRHKGLPALKGTAALREGALGPVRVILGDSVFTLYVGGHPAPASR